jgi:hypothetical protein
MVAALELDKLDDSSLKDLRDQTISKLQDKAANLGPLLVEYGIIRQSLSDIVTELRRRGIE